MSEPWIRVYAGEMRGDPAVARLNGDMRYALIQAWDLAKNGPGDPCHLVAEDGSMLVEKELRSLCHLDPYRTRGMFRMWARLGLCDLTVDGGVTFPNLARRQGIDRTAAARKRRQRQRERHGNVTPLSRESHGEMSRHVTPESTEERGDREDPSIEGSSLSAAPPKPRPRDLVWDALIEGCGYSPGTQTERGAWNKARKEIADQPPDAVAAKAAEFKRRYPDLRCTPTALVRQWGALGETNGKPPRRPIEEVLAEAEKAGF